MRLKKLIILCLAVVGFLGLTGAVYAGTASLRMRGWEFDPEKHHHVIGKWQYRLGQADAFGGNHNFGVLLSKNTTTSELAAGGLSLTKGYHFINNNGGLQQVGYDIRDGSHCGAGAPRFNIVGTVGTAAKDNKTYFIGCNSPPPTSEVDGVGWRTLTWGSSDNSAPLMAFGPEGLVDIRGIQVKSIDIVFDEGTDVGNGLAILDNINIDGTIITRPGATDPSDPESMAIE